MNEEEKNEFRVVLDSFYNTLEPLEEYIGKMGYYSDWESKRQIYRKSIADSDSTAEVFEDVFLTDLYIIVASVKDKNEPFRKKIQEEYYKWINATGIDADNCPEKLKHYLFEINEILEGRWENFVKQMKEEVARIEIDLNKPENRKLLNDVFTGVHNESNHPPERKKINIEGNVKAGEEVLRQIATEIASDHQNFRFFPQKEEQAAKENKENIVKPLPKANQSNNKNISLVIILGIILLSGLILIGYLFWREREREKKKYKIKNEQSKYFN